MFLRYTVLSVCFRPHITHPPSRYLMYRPSKLAQLDNPPLRRYCLFFLYTVGRIKMMRALKVGLLVVGVLVVVSLLTLRDVTDPIRKNSIMLETRTWYGIPHSVTISPTARGDKFYIGGSEQDFRLQKEFPYSKAWWANIARDPRVRMKIDGKIYEMTVALIADRVEIAQIIGRNPITKEIGANGKEQITGVRHYWRVYQRNIPEYGDGSIIQGPE